MSRHFSPLDVTCTTPPKRTLFRTFTKPLSPLSSPAKNAPSDGLRVQTVAMIRTLHQQQSELLQVTRENREMEDRLLRLEAELRTLKKDQAEADELISNLVDIFTCMKPRGDALGEFEKEHPALYSRLRGFRDRLHSFLATKRE